jgi:outer membrane protein assembly factor BamB
VPTATPSAPPPGPLPGNLLIADRGNGRLLIVSPAGRVLWSLTLDRHAGWSGPPLAADDAFFTADGTQISINAEDEDVIARVDIASRRIVWSYGHDGVASSRTGYLNTPDDAYPLPNGDTLVADIFNERILEVSPQGSIVRQVGTTRLRRHDPPAAFAAPNGDTPLPDGGMLVTEIGGSYVDRLDAGGSLVWSVHLPGIHYPSDAQLLPDGNILVVDYHSPGAVAVFTPRGSLVWSYRVLSGSGRLEHPSLAIRLPNGNYAVTDDDNNRVVVIDPTTNRIVWQYGHRGVAGTRPGYLNGPDGLDFAGPAVRLAS